MKTYTVTVNGLGFVQAVIARLADRSQWFTFEPLPDDDYEVTVKAENKGMIDRIVVEVTFPDRDAGWLGTPEEIEANRKAGSFAP